jgi:hypothetical protein
MNRIDLENALRPVLQNIGIVGTRGPPKDWVFPAMLAGTLGFLLVIVLLVNLYELVFTKTCPLCGQKHPE